MEGQKHVLVWHVKSGEDQAGARLQVGGAFELPEVVGHSIGRLFNRKRSNWMTFQLELEGSFDKNYQYI